MPDENVETNEQEPKSRRVYSESTLKKMAFPEKQAIAREFGFDVLWKTEEELDRILSGKTKAGGIRYSRVDAMGLTKDDIDELKKGNQQVPQDTFIPEGDYDDWMKIIAKNPMAFNAVDLSDKTTETVHILEKDKKEVECVCGAVFSIPDWDDNKNPVSSFPCPGIKKTVRGMKGRPRDVRVCLGENRFRQFVIHKVPED